MSTTAEFVDGANFDEAIKSVRSDESDDKYVVVQHVEGDPNRLTVLKTGQDVEEMTSHLDDTQTMYALARYESTFDMSTTVKFVYFHWMGDKVAYVKRGRYGVVHGSVEKYFSPYHLLIETSNVEDLDTEKILQQLEENTGKKSKVIENTEGRQERGFTQSQLPNRGPVSKSGPELSKSGAKIEISPNVLSDIGAVRADDNDTRWCLGEYQDGNAKGPIINSGTGEGDISEMSDILGEDKAMYGLYRVTDTMDDITTVKFVLITWVGSSVKPMTKAKISTHKGVIEETYGPYHVAIFATDRSEVSEHAIMEKVTSASGTKSHVM